MATIFEQTRKKGTRVLPSGIECELLSLQGKQQHDLTINDEAKRKDAIDNMLLECTARIGSNTSVSMADIMNLFSEDRKFMLFELQQLSNSYDPNFIFAYEFPTEGGKKLKQIYEVVFDKEDFPRVPYKWVLEAMITQYKEKNSIAADETLDKETIDKIIFDAEEFPILFNNYSEIITKYKTNKTVVKESGVTMVWNILDGNAEKENMKMDTTKISSHTFFQNRNCKYLDPESLIAGKEIPMLIPYDKVSSNDLEQLRSAILDFEASIETSVVVKYKNDNSKQANVNLITTPAFFFPSLAR